MMKHLLVGLAGAALVVGVSASAANAQCSFPHPKKAGKYQTNLVQAFVSCGNVGGNSPNAVAGGSTPSCQPVETFFEQSGNVSTGWRFDPLVGQGQLQLKSAKAPYKTVPPDTGQCGTPCNPPGDTVDVNIALKLSGVSNSSGLVGLIAPGDPGTLATVSRATFDDRTSGDMTVVDFPAQFNFNVFKGKTSLKTSADTLLNGAGLAGLPHCTSLENVVVTILDTNGDTFAVPGVFMP